MGILNDIAYLWDELNKWSENNPWKMALLVSIVHALAWRVIHQNTLGYFDAESYLMGVGFGIVIYYFAAALSVWSERRK